MRRKRAVFAIRPCYGAEMPALHEKPIVISEAHLDSFGHLNNARYLEIFEQARWDLITERGHGIDVIRKTGTGPTVLGIEMRFTR